MINASGHGGICIRCHTSYEGYGCISCVKDVTMLNIATFITKLLPMNDFVIRLVVKSVIAVHWIRSARKKLKQYVIDKIHGYQYGYRFNNFGEKVPNIEYYFDKNRQIKIRKFQGYAGSWTIVGGKRIRIADRVMTAQVLGESSIENARQIAEELIDQDIDTKVEKRAKMAEEKEMATANRSYGFNNAFMKSSYSDRIKAMYN